ncbi:hypothetical protein B2G71_04465 [Novosphingobium sp. PC22D]|uniref:nuclear transport factor 2 family protein n=1 Tax=Novosphingobium sp. PC22D TaxID=1962403 RepID=UPI000BF08EE6|nr:nuclear transport factor 2 family protein [Novosphingobium sp. PC22D]PEQ13590.1 hypothetical protein B2G71_04465 [Novosphingobium sp. PC22D]
MADTTSRIPSADRLQELLDRQEIFDCIKRISRAIDRFDEDLFVSGFHEDALIDAGAFVEQPRTVYRGGMELHEAGQSSTLHHLTNHTCRIDGSEAHAETYFLYFGRNRDGTNWAAGGRYADRLECRDGDWRIAFRCTLLEWSGMIEPTDVPLFANVEDLGVNGVSARSREDASYRRPLVNRRTIQSPETPGALGDPRGKRPPGA